MYTNLWPSELEVSSRLLSLIRLQKWVCSLSPLSPACLPLPPSNSFCLPHFLLLLCLSLSGFRSLKVCVIQASPSGTATDHLSRSLILSLVYVPSLPSLPLFLHPTSRQPPDRHQPCSWSTLPAGGWKPCDSPPPLLHILCCWPTNHPSSITPVLPAWTTAHKHLRFVLFFLSHSSTQ